MKYDLHWNNTGLVLFFLLSVLHPCICVTFLPPLIKQSAFIKITFIFIKLLIDRLGRFKHFYFFHYGWRNVAFTTHIILGHNKLPSYSVATKRLTEKTPKFNFCEGQNISRTPWKAFVSVLYLSSFYLRLIWNFYFLSLWIYIYIYIGYAAQLVGFQFPDQGSNPCPQHWKHRVLTSGLPGNSLDIIIQTSFWGNVLNLPEKNNWNEFW